MSRKTKRRAGLLLALCALTIAGILAASSLAAAGTKNADNEGAGSGWPGFGLGGVVHSEAIVLDEAGTAYITQTLDSGTVESASAGELVIEEGTKAMPYKTVTLKIPGDATVVRDGSEAALGEFEAGDFVVVSHSSDGTYVCGGDNQGPGWFGSRAWGPGSGQWGHGGGPWGAGDGPGPWGSFGGY